MYIHITAIFFYFKMMVKKAMVTQQEREKDIVL